MLCSRSLNISMMMSKKRKMKKHGRAKRRSAGDSDSSDSEMDDTEIRVFKNHIYFWSSVTKKTALDLTLKLQQLYNEVSAYSLNGDEPTPIYVHINSYGGDTDAALGVIDTMSSLKEHGAFIITIIEGNCSSAATLISVAGSERRMRPNAYMRIHQFTTGIWGKKQDLDDEHKNLDKLENILLDFYRKHTNLNKTQLKKLLSREIDLTISECIEHGLVDSKQE